MEGRGVAVAEVAKAVCFLPMLVETVSKEMISAIKEDKQMTGHT